jgi:hypothetical protein
MGIFGVLNACADIAFIAYFVSQAGFPKPAFF